jgi:hypothetical protein
MKANFPAFSATEMWHSPQDIIVLGHINRRGPIQAWPPQSPALTPILLRIRLEREEENTQEQ